MQLMFGTYLDFGVRAGSQDRLGVLCYRDGEFSSPYLCKQFATKSLQPTSFVDNLSVRVAYQENSLLSMQHLNQSVRLRSFLYGQGFDINTKTEWFIFLTRPAC